MKTNNIRKIIANLLLICVVTVGNIGIIEIDKNESKADANKKSSSTTYRIDPIGRDD